MIIDNRLYRFKSIFGYRLRALLATHKVCYLVAGIFPSDLEKRLILSSTQEPAKPVWNDASLFPLLPAGVANTARGRHQRICICVFALYFHSYLSFISNKISSFPSGIAWQEGEETSQRRRKTVQKKGTKK